ncbi:MAG: RNA polymerase sigma-54 factor [Alphaproteobacteria bacterium]|nr:MAG: RNA polymerase sigma-54 factor [Alphaproteobacteria bacterium]
MAIGPRLQLRQSQQLVLTPQLQQAIKLLQMPNLELAAYLRQQVEQNPLLEMGGEDPMPEIEDYATLSEGDPMATPDEEVGIPAADTGMTGEGMIADADAPLDADFEETVFDDAPVDRAAGDAVGHVASTGSGGGERADPWSASSDPFERQSERPPDLRTHLMEQVPLVVEGAAERLIAARLVDLLDERGYLTADLDELAEDLGAEPRMIEKVLAGLRTLEPTGVFARDLADCLALQLAERDRLDPAMKAMLDHLPLVAKRDLRALKRLCGVDEEDLLEMIRELRTLDPQPGLAFMPDEATPVIPDVFVRRLAGGGFGVELNQDTLPKVLVNRSYYAELASRVRGGEDRQFLSGCLADANWLVRALDQRARTILKVASTIVKRQEGFFLRGVEALRPMTLKDIAEEIEMHESTVSRVTSTKYMATPRGVVPFRAFFTSAIQSTGGGAELSSAAVRARIRALVDAEDPRKVLSDDRIVQLLKEEGIDIARRTVAKYREAMGIPSSVERRRLKRMPA